MTKSIFELEKSDVEQYMTDKGIKDCPLCQSKNTLEPVYDDDLKVVFKEAVFKKFNQKENTLDTVMDGFELLITCKHCGTTSTIAPGNVLATLDTQD